MSRHEALANLNLQNITTLPLSATVLLKTEAMADLQVKSLIFKKIPAGRLVPGEHIEVVSNPADLTLPPTGGLSFKLLQVGLDPFMRDRMHESTKDRYVPVFDLGSPINNSCIAKVIESSIDDFEKDDLITAILPFAEYGVLPKELLGPLQVAKVVELPPGIDHSLLLGPLGLAGATAWVSYFGIVKEDQEGLRAHPGKSFDVTHRGADIKTMWVSSAASSVGQIVGQLAKRDGYRVIGSVGSDEKLDFIVNTLGYDAGFNYKTEKAKDAIPRLAPDGLDCYYDNVGGDHLQAALDNMKPHGTICCCGSVSFS